MQLVEISLPLDPGAALVYEALAELIDGCIKELRKVERLDTTDLTAARGLSASLDEAVRRQLAPVWHTVSPKTRQIVADLRTLRTLASFLQKFDPITFLTYLDTLRATEGTNCAWLFHSAAHTVFEAAKRRVYQLTAPSQQAAAKRRRKEGADPSEAGTDADGAASVSVPSVEPALEELPKWHALLEVLAEARADAAKVTAATGGDGNDGQDGSAVAVATPPVVVFCQDEFTCRQLRGVVGPDGPGGFMRNLYREFLQYKIDVATGGRRGSGAATTGTNGFNGAPSSRMMGGYLPGEEAALVKEARGLGATRTAGRGQGRRGGGRGGRGRGRAAAAAAAAAAALEKAAAAAPKHDDSPATSPEKGTGSGDMVGGDGSGASPRKAPKAPSDPADVRFVALDTSGALALWTYDPSHVVVYDPDVALTRSLEVFKAQRRSRPLRVYLLRYDDSPEMDRYQNSVVRERSAFENLIRAKGIMAPATVTGAPTAALAPVGAGNAQPEGNALTRRAGGRLAPQPERVKIIVDVREFMSPLPAVLHAQGFTVIPLTLEVGDYVLSPEICVERKSLPDLRGSLQSGRLYQQAEAMCRHYRTAILLIEFEGDRAFALQSPGELGDDIQSHSMMSRLVLLCLHHPRLRLVWSRSLHATADIFKRMKAHHEEPDPVAAATVGLDAESGAAVETLINTAAIDVLRRLPGVTDANYRALMREAGSLQRLATLPLARLTLVMGGEVAARKLHEFLQQECQALFKAL